MACDWCEKRVPLIDFSHLYGSCLIIERDAKSIELVSFDRLVSFGRFECNYCPMCGEKLDDAQ